MKITIGCGNHDIIFTDDIHSALTAAFRQLTPFPDKIFVLTDVNTSRHCFPVLATWPELELTEIKIGAGEKHKNINSCGYIWNELLKHGASRESLLINLGGGMVTDTGGFAASVYMRGIRFMHIPTSLMGMVDASAGGKTAIDWESYKNMIGTFSFPEMVLVDRRFLDTLPDKEWKNGFAEIIKHALISGTDLVNDFYSLNNEPQDFTDFATRQAIKSCIEKSIRIKADVICRDPYEKNERRFLNFGHTVGHAIESYSLKKEQNPVSHGEAVAIGLICESYISNVILGFPLLNVEQLGGLIKSIYKYYPLKEKNFSEYMKFMTSDKKATHGNIAMTLLKVPGQPVISDIDSPELIEKAFKYYNALHQ